MESSCEQTQPGEGWELILCTKQLTEQKWQ